MIYPFIVRARTSFSPSIFFYYLMMAIMDFIAEGCYLFNPLTKESIPIWLGLSNIRELASIYNLPTKVSFIFIVLILCLLRDTFYRFMFALDSRHNLVNC